MTQILFLRLIERIITNLTLLKGLQVRYYIIIAGKLTYYGYGGIPTVAQGNKCEFVIDIQVFYKDQWRTVYSHPIDKVESVDETFCSCIANLASEGVEFYFASIMQQIFEQEQVAIKEEMLKQQQKELIELAENKAKQEAWANRKLHVKIKDSITGKKLLTS